MRGLFHTSKRAAALGRCCSGVHVEPFSVSYRTAWRCENVPRSVSCPVRRTSTPSISSDAKASDSACPQSMPPASPIASRRRSSCLARRGCTCNVSGHASSRSLSATSSSARTAVGPGGRRRRRGPRQPRAPRDSFTVGVRVLESLHHLLLFSRARPASVTTPSRTRRSARTWRGVGCDRIAWYSVGCVNEGSSPSLCPQRR